MKKYGYEGKEEKEKNQFSKTWYGIYRILLPNYYVVILVDHQDENKSHSYLFCIASQAGEVNPKKYFVHC